MDLIRLKSDDGSISLAEPIILAAEPSRKDNLHLGKALKSDYREDFMKAMEKRNKIFDLRRFLGNTSKIITSNFSAYNTMHMDFQEKNKPLWRTNQT